MTPQYFLLFLGDPNSGGPNLWTVLTLLITTAATIFTMIWQTRKATKEANTDRAVVKQKLDEQNSITAVREARRDVQLDVIATEVNGKMARATTELAESKQALQGAHRDIVQLKDETITAVREAATQEINKALMTPPPVK